MYRFRRTGLDDVDERDVGLHRRLAHERQVQEVLVVVAVSLELVVVVAEQLGSADLQPLAQVLSVGLGGIALGAQLLGGGVGRKQVDVGWVLGIALAEIVQQPGKLGKPDGARLVADVVGVQGGMVFDLVDHRVDPGAARRVVDDDRVVHRVEPDQIDAQSVLVGDVEILHGAAPGRVEAAIDQLAGHAGRQRTPALRSAPGPVVITGDWGADLPHDVLLGFSCGGSAGSSVSNHSQRTAMTCTCAL